jgi:hypothetical protein
MDQDNNMTPETEETVTTAPAAGDDTATDTDGGEEGENSHQEGGVEETPAPQDEPQSN